MNRRISVKKMPARDLAIRASHHFVTMGVFEVVIAVLKSGQVYDHTSKEAKDEIIAICRSEINRQAGAHIAPLNELSRRDDLAKKEGSREV